jgi:hypothetical protein
VCLTEEGASVGCGNWRWGTVLAGVLITGGFGLVFDGRRRRREDRRRWHDDRRRAYAELLFAVRFAFAGACRGARVAPERGAYRPLPEWEVGYGTEEIHSWMQRANEASAEVQLIASEPVRTAAAELLSIHRQLGDLLKVILLGETRPVEEVTARVDALEGQEAEARRRHWSLLRVELGVDAEGGSPKTSLTLQASWGAVAARAKHRRSRRPCHPRATGSGHERYSADSHGHLKRSVCLDA